MCVKKPHTSDQIQANTLPSERGQVLPLVALSLVVLLGAAALAIDVGYLRDQQRIQQIATDSAAFAGASELSFKAPSLITSGAMRDALNNGYANGVGNVTVAVNSPPQSGAYSGSPTAVEVVITSTHLPTFFGNVIGALNPSVTTRAVAAVNPNELGCVYVLNGGLTLHGGGGGGIASPTCGLLINGDLSVTGSANVDALFVGYTGTNSGGGSYPAGQPIRLTVPVSDPCQRFPACAYLSALNVSALPCVDTTPQNSAALPPGHYCHKVSGSITFAPTAGNALYVFDQPLSGGSMSGAGVTIYNNSASGITWSGNVSVDISGPTTGPTAGMAYYQPPSNCGSITKNGAAGSVDFVGGFYAPSAAMTLNGSLPSVSLIVVGSIVMNGGGMDVSGGDGLVQAGHPVLVQ